MATYCLICECEPIDESNWYYCAETTESVCPACVRDMRKFVDEKKIILK